MDMDHPSSGQHQQMCNNSVEKMIACSNAQQENKPKALKCPRCDSANTKFCYYNNYSLSQPRYFCKSCRRYWTKGGTLRNVPVGGRCKKNKTSSSSSSSSKRAKVQAFTPNPNTLIGFTPMSFESNDLNLVLARLQNGSFGYDDHDHSILGNHTNTNTNTNTSTPFDNIVGNLDMNPLNPGGFLDALISGFFLGTHNNNNGMQNMYYGFGNGENMGEVDNGKNNGLGEMMVPYDPSQPLSIATTQAVSGGGDTNMAQPNESGIASWNNGFTPSWHGLVNSSSIM